MTTIDNHDSDSFDDPFRDLHGAPAGASPRRAGAVLNGQFRLIEQIANGGQGEVWGAWEIRPGRFVALKFVHRGLLRVEEAQTAASIPGNVIGVYQYNENVRENPFLVMEYARGGPLGRLGAVWRANPALLIEKFIPVVKTVVQTHALGIYHRDFKPDNLLLCADPPPRRRDDPEPAALPDRDGVPPGAYTVKIGDWGLAASEGDPDVGWGGTPGFAAPEQWRGAATPASDVFGLAATLYFLLTGRHVMPTTAAFLARLRADADRLAYEPPDPIHVINPKVDPRLSRIIMKSLAANPGDRHGSADALAYELKRWLTGKAIPGDSRVRAAGLWAQRNWPMVAAGVLVLALGVAWVEAALAGARHREASARAEADAAEQGKLAAEANARQLEAERVRELIDQDRIAARARTAFLEQNERVAALWAAASRGDWPEALRLYKSEVRESDWARSEEGLKLRAELLDGYFATNDMDGLRTELDLLATEPLGQYEAKVLLAHGMYLLCHPGQQEAGRAKVRQALAVHTAFANKGALTPADVSYAQALLEDRPRAVIDKLREAARLSDRHHYAPRMSLAVALFAAGQLTAAREQCEAVAELFPAAHGPPILRCLLAVGCGRHAAARFAITCYAARPGADSGPLTEYCGRLDAALAVLRDRPDAVQVNKLGTLENWLSAMEDLSRATGPRLLPDPFAPAVVVWARALIAQAREAFTHPFHPPTLALLERGCNDSPDAMYPLLAAFVCAELGEWMGDAGFVVRGRFEMGRGAQFASTAAAGESLLARGAGQYLIRWSGVCMQIYVLKWTPDPDPDHLHHLRLNLYRVLVDGATWPDLRTNCVCTVIRATSYPPPPRMVEGWRLDTVAGATAYRNRLRELRNLVRTLLDGWAQTDHDPDQFRKMSDDLDRWAELYKLDDRGPALPWAPAPRPK